MHARYGHAGPRRLPAARNRWLPARYTRHWNTARIHMALVATSSKAHRAPAATSKVLRARVDSSRCSSSKAPAATTYPVRYTGHWRLPARYTGHWYTGHCCSGHWWLPEARYRWLPARHTGTGTQSTVAQATGGYQQQATGGYKAHRSMVHRVLVSTSNSKVHRALVRRALVAASSKTPAGTEQDTQGAAIFQQGAHGTHWRTGHR